MIFYIGDRNSEYEGAKRDTSPDRAGDGITSGRRAPATKDTNTHAGLTRDQAGTGQTGSNSRFVFFACANADDALDVGHENLAVADLAGTGCADDGVDDLIRL